MRFKKHLIIHAILNQAILKAFLIPNLKCSYFTINHAEEVLQLFCQVSIIMYSGRHSFWTPSTDLSTIIVKQTQHALAKTCIVEASFTYSPLENMQEEIPLRRYCNTYMNASAVSEWRIRTSPVRVSPLLLTCWLALGNHLSYQLQNWT